MTFVSSAGIFNPLIYEPKSLEERCAMGHHEIFVGEFRCDCGKRFASCVTRSIQEYLKNTPPPKIIIR